MNFRFHFRRSVPAPPAAKRRVMIPLRVVYVASLSCLIAATGGSIWGLYRMVERTLLDSAEVLRLQREVADEPMQADAYRQAVERLEVKQRQGEPPDWSQVVNPFQSNRTASAPTSSSPLPPIAP